MALEFHEPHGTQTQFPEGARGMQEVEMRGEPGGTNGARHGEAALEERPVKSLPVERHQHRALGQPGGEFVQERMLLAKIAHEELLDLKTASIPPGDSYKEGVSTGAAGEAGGFGIEKEPLRGVFDGGKRTARERCVAAAGEQVKSDGGEGSKDSGVANQLLMARCSPKWLRETAAPASFAKASASEAREKRADAGVARAGLSAESRANLSIGAVIYGQSRPRMARAASLALRARSPTGPTQEGQPWLQVQLEMRSRVWRRSSSCARKSGSEKPMPPG